MAEDACAHGQGWWHPRPGMLTPLPEGGRLGGRGCLHPRLRVHASPATKTTLTSHQDHPHQPPRPPSPATKTTLTSHQDHPHQPPGPPSPATRTTLTSHQDHPHQPPRPPSPATKTTLTSHQDHPHQPPRPPSPAAKTRPSAHGDSARRPARLARPGMRTRLPGQQHHRHQLPGIGPPGMETRPPGQHARPGPRPELSRRQAPLERLVSGLRLGSACACGGGHILQDARLRGGADGRGLDLPACRAEALFARFACRRGAGSLWNRVESSTLLRKVVP